MKSDEFIREVDDELKQERLATLWQRFGALVIGVAVLIVAGTAGYVGWDAWKSNQRAAESRAYAAAEALAEAGDYNAAADAFLEIAESSGAGIAALARMRAAAAAAEAGEPAEAVSILESVASDNGTDSLLREAALLAKVTREFDQASPATIIQELEPLTQPGAPWRLLARELTALAMIRQGDVTDARDILAGIRDDAEATALQRRRAEELFTALGGNLESAS
ncbi:MAG: tetratricopeptide repeat protein [Pseudomonadota bacterium]